MLPGVLSKLIFNSYFIKFWQNFFSVHFSIEIHKNSPLTNIAFFSFPSIFFIQNKCTTMQQKVKRMSHEYMYWQYIVVGTKTIFEWYFLEIYPLVKYLCKKNNNSQIRGHYWCKPKVQYCHFCCPRTLTCCGV